MGWECSVPIPGRCLGRADWGGAVWYTVPAEIPKDNNPGNPKANSDTA